MAGGGLSVGGVVANLGARLDDAAFDRWERRVKDARRSATDDVEARLAGDYDERGFRQFDDRLDRTRREARNDVEAKLKADADETGFRKWTGRLERARTASRDRVEAKLGADVDTRGFDRYEQRLQDVDGAHTNLISGSGRVRGAMGSLFIGGAGVAGAGIAFGALAVGAKKAVDQFEESEVVARRQALVIRTMGQDAGASAEHVNTLAASLSKKTGIDDDTIISGANVIRTFRNIRNEAGEGNDVFDRTTKAALDLSAAFGTDLQSASIMLGKALDDPAKGAAALSRTGAIAKSDVEALKKAAEDGTPKLELQRRVLEAVEKQVRGSAASSATASQKMRTSMGEMAESVGERVAPAFNRAVGGIRRFVDELRTGQGAGGRFGDRMRSVGRGVERAWDGVGDVFRRVGRFIGRAIDENRDTLDSMGRTVRSLAGTAGRVLDGLADAFRSVFSSRSGTSRDLRTFIRALLDIADAGLKVLDAITKRALPGIIQAFQGFFRVLRGVIRLVTGLLTGDFDKAWEGVKDIFGGGIKAVGGIIRAGTAPLRAGAAAIGKAVAGAFRSAWEGITDTARGFVNGIIKVINLIPGVNIKPLREKLEPASRAGYSGADVNARRNARGFARGGAYGMTGGYVDEPIAVMGEEAPEFPEWVIPENPAYRGRALELWQAAGERLGAFRKGGRAFVDQARSFVGRARAFARGGRYSRDELEALWSRVNPGLGNSRLMAAIALAESGGDASIVNRIGAGGLWQIHPPEPGYLDPVTNARIAGRKLRTQGLQAWEAYTKGMHTKFLGGSGGGLGGAIRGLFTRVVETAAQVAKRVAGKLPENPGGVLAGAFKWALGKARDYIKAKATDVLESVKGAIGMGGAGVKTGTWAKARKLAAEFGARITSAHRTPAQNAAANGAPNSSHMRGTPSNPGAHDFVPPSAGLVQRALQMGAIFAENHDYGSGLHSHVSWFRRGGRARGLAARFPSRFGAFRHGGAHGGNTRGTNRGGGRVRPGMTRPKPSKRESVNAGVARSVARGELGIAKYEGELQDLEREYDQADRRYGMSDEVFLVEHPDGSTTVDEGAVNARVDELNKLHHKRTGIKKKIEAYRRALARLIRTLTNAIKRLQRALKAAGGKSRKKERAGYREAIKTYTERIDELRATHKDLGYDVEDQRIDLAELEHERAEVANTTGQAADPADPTPPDPAPTDTGSPAPETPGEIAAQAAQMYQAFQAERAGIFRDFGGNNVAVGGNPYDTPTGQAAGTQFFGAAGGAVPNAYAAPGGRVTYIERAEFTSQFGGPPPSGETYVQQQAREVGLAFS